MQAIRAIAAALATGFVVGAVLLLTTGLLLAVTVGVVVALVAGTVVALLTGRAEIRMVRENR